MNRFGPRWLDHGEARFRLWAPQAEHGVALLLGIDGAADPTTTITTRSPAAGEPGGMAVLDRCAPMRARDGGWYELDVRVGPGTAYAFEIAGSDAAQGSRRVPDPASRRQHGDVHDPSVLLGSTYAWRHADWLGRPWHEAVILEVHAGLHGGFRGLLDQLPIWAAQGITALELMPVADFPGPRNWGYDGVLPFAPDGAYGTPDELRNLIDAAHGLGLMVVLDVVYNHFGPEGNHLHAYARDFFRADRQTPWGDAIDFRQPEVRRFFLENALYWLEDFRFDGLRIDAAHAIGAPDWLDELARVVRARQGGRHIHLILEHDDNAADHLRHGFDAQWNDDAHHVLHTLLTGERDGYYGDYADRTGEGLARWLAGGFVYRGEPSAHRGGAARGTPADDLPPTAFVNFLQNHDQIGNRAHGERLTRLAEPAALRVAAALLLLCPQIPLLFDGELDDSTAPFLYFTSHPPALAEAVRAGRRREFASFPGFDEQTLADLPDPNDPETFARSHPQAEGGQRSPTQAEAWLHLRHQALIPYLPGCRPVGALALGAAAVAAAWRLGDGRLWLMLVNLGPTPIAAPFKMLTRGSPLGAALAHRGPLEQLAWIAAPADPPPVISTRAATPHPARVAAGPPPLPDSDIPLPGHALLVLVEAARPLSGERT